MSATGWFWVFFGTAALCAIGMQVPAWLEGRNNRKPVSADRAPMSPAGKAQIKSAAWLLCTALLGGLVGGSVATRGATTSAASHHEESEFDAADISKLEREISDLKYRVRDLEDKAR